MQVGYHAGGVFENAGRQELLTGSKSEGFVAERVDEIWVAFLTTGSSSTIDIVAIKAPLLGGKWKSIIVAGHLANCSILTDYKLYFSWERRSEAIPGDNVEVESRPLRS